MTGQARSSGWSIRVETVRPVSAAAFPWRSGGDRWAMTVVVKATFSIVEEGLAELIAPTPLCRVERFAGDVEATSARDGRGSLLEEPDLAPYKGQVDVTFVGSVHAAHPVQALRGRLAVVGADEGIDKSFQVVGDRRGPGTAPLPFRQMPLVWERAWASAENPIGVPASGADQANVVDPRNPTAAVGLGPIARGWPSRARLLGSLDRTWVEAPTPDLPLGFAWEYFQAAPRDQRLTRLRGGETLLLENLLEGRPRLRTRLPGARACARLHAPWVAAEGQTLELAADSLQIDGEAQTVSIVWRASIPVPRADLSFDGMHVVAGVELPGFPMPWPAVRPGPPRTTSSPSIAALAIHAAASAPTVLAPASSSAAPAAPGATMALTPEDAQRLLASAPRPVPFGGGGGSATSPLARTQASTLPSPGSARSNLDPPTRPLPISIIAAPPPPPPSGEPAEEATRQMGLHVLLDEETLAALQERPGRPQSPEPRPTGSSPEPQPRRTPADEPPASASTMAFTPEQASAMLAAAGHRMTSSGGFPPPVSSPPLGPPPFAAGPPVAAPPFVAPPMAAPPPIAPPPRVAPPHSHPGVDDEMDTSGETFALTPEQAHQMMADAARKKRG